MIPPTATELDVEVLPDAVLFPGVALLLGVGAGIALLNALLNADEKALESSFNEETADDPTTEVTASIAAEATESIAVVVISYTALELPFSSCT